jgi:hypothetical protein
VSSKKDEVVAVDPINASSRASHTAAHTAGARAIRNALRFMFEAPVVLVGTSMVMFGLDALVCAVARLAPVGLAIVLTANLFRILLRAWLRPGYLRALDEARRGGDPSVDTVGSGIDCIGSTFVAHLVGDLVAFLSVLVGALPGLTIVSLASQRDVPAIWETAGIALTVVGSALAFLYAWLGVRFAEHVIALEGRGPFAALGRAWRIASGRRIAIASIVLFSAASELVSLVWGLACLGLGVFWTVPVSRMVGDHALLARFDELRSAHDRDARECEARERQARERDAALSLHWKPRFLGARGASLPEYALLLAAIVLVAGSAYRSLGRSAGAAAGRAASALSAPVSDGAKASSVSGASAAASFLGDVVKGLVEGDFASGPPSAGKTIGETLGSFIPVYGQVAAVRDVAAAVVDLAHGKGSVTDVGIATLGALPGLGPELKAASKAVQAGEKAALREGAALISAERAANRALAEAGLKALSDAEKAEIHAFLSESKVPAAAAADVVKGFAGGSRVEVLEKDLTVYRYHGGVKEPRGRFVTETPTKSPKDDLALPAENPATQVAQFVIPKGTKVVRGPAATLNGRPGGGNQIFLPDSGVLRDP